MDNQQEEKERIEDEKLIEQIRDEFAKLTVKDFLNQTLLTLSTLAYQKMGIPDANKSHKDLDQAKLAIDAYSDLFKCLEPCLEPDETDAFKQVLSKLKLDFVSTGNQK